MDETQDPNLDQILRQLGELAGQEHVSADYVHFRAELLKAQHQARAAAARSPAAPAGELSQTGLLDPTALPLDRAALTALLDTIQSAAGDQDQQSAAIARLKRAADQQRDLLKQLAVQTTCPLDWEYVRPLAARLEVSTDALVFVGRVLAAPFLSILASRIKTPDSGASSPRTDEPGYCPVCGSTPALAKLEGERGNRVLCCSLCGHWWDFVRLACPSCGNQGKDSLIKLTIADDDPRWIEVCEECQGYIKTVDTRKLPAGAEAFPVVEETATLHLDLLAEREGYRRKLPYAALI